MIFQVREYTMTGQLVDVVVVGAGVVGCAIARAITTAFPMASVAVLERHSAPGTETSTSNSGVIHSGIHLPPDSMKARFAQIGAKVVPEYCRARDIPHRVSGMHIVAASRDVFYLPRELANLRSLRQNARACGITIAMRTPWHVQRHEPAIRCLMGIWIPSVVIVDSGALVHALVDDAADHGAVFLFNHDVLSIVCDGPVYSVETTGSTLRARVVVNAAGLGAAHLSDLAGLAHPDIVYIRGEYYEVIDAALRESVRGLVYPVYRPQHPGLGIHLTPTIDGRLLLGPNAVPLASIEDRLLHRTPPEVFVQAVKPFFPACRAAHLRYAYDGIRTTIVHGPSSSDFYLALERRNPWFVNCLGIESPGLTASFGIASAVREMIAPALLRS
jgi:L-2-hydroxyglutarate oxidase LhgO